MIYFKTIFTLLINYNMVKMVKISKNLSVNYSIHTYKI